MRDFLKKDWVIRVISILVSLIIWIYVVYFQNPQYEKWIRDIPISKTNVSTDFSNGKLKIMNTNSDTIDIKVRGSRRTIAKLNNHNIKVNSDMIGIDKEGEYSLATNVVFSVGGVTVLNKEPYNFDITVDKVANKKIKIDVKKEGALKSGHEIDTQTITPENISVTGPQSILNSISKAVISVDVSNKTSDIKGNYVIELFDSQNQKVTYPDLSKSVESAEALFTIAATKEVKIVPNVKFTPLSDDKQVDVSVSGNKTVVIKGKSEVLDRISEIYTKEYTFPSTENANQALVELDIPENISLANGEDNKAKIIMTVK